MVAGAGAAWSPDAGASDLFGLLQSGRAFIFARRLLDGGQNEEMLQIEFDTADPFRSASYRLTGGPAASVYHDRSLRWPLKR